MTLLPFVPQIQHTEMGRKNRHTNVTGTLHTSGFGGKQRDLFCPNKTTGCSTNLLYLHKAHRHTHTAATNSGCRLCLGTHSLPIHKDRRTRSVTCVWNTAGDTCRTGCTGMYHNALNFSEKGSEHLHTKRIWHIPSIIDLPSSSCSCLSSEVPKRNLQILSHHFSTWWSVFLALNSPSPYTMPSSIVSHIYQTYQVLIPWTKPLIYTYRSCFFPAEVCKMNHLKSLNYWYLQQLQGKAHTEVPVPH